MWEVRSKGLTFLLWLCSGNGECQRPCLLPIRKSYGAPCNGFLKVGSDRMVYRKVRLFLYPLRPFIVFCCVAFYWFLSDLWLFRGAWTVSLLRTDIQFRPTYTNICTLSILIFIKKSPKFVLQYPMMLRRFAKHFLSLSCRCMRHDIF